MKSFFERTNPRTSRADVRDHLARINGFNVSFLEIKNFRESKREKKTRLETNEGFFILEDNRCFVENGGGHSSLLFPPIGDTIPRYMSWKEVSMAEQTPYNITVKHPLPMHRGTCTSIKS